MQQQETADSGLHPTLSFSELEKKISIYLPDNSDPDEDRKGMLAIAGTIGSYGAIQLLNVVLPNKTPAWFALLMLCIAAISMLWILYTTIKREIPGIRDRRRISAADLDEQSDGFKKVVAWLRSFSQEELEEKLDFVQRKIETIELRSGALFGNIERFGFLAVLVALYLQFKDATISWPPNVTLSSLLLIAAILAVYFAGVWATSYKWQLNIYRQLLQMATKSPL